MSFEEPVDLAYPVRHRSNCLETDIPQFVKANLVAGDRGSRQKWPSGRHMLSSTNMHRGHSFIHVPRPAGNVGGDLQGEYDKQPKV
jgi:hypothetical protein